MLALKNALGLISLFMLICSTNIYGDICQSSNGEVNVSANDIEKNQNSKLCKKHKKHKKHKLSYYLYVSDFIDSLISIQTTPVSVDSTTIDSKYLAGRAPIYNVDGEKAGICSASFLCLKNEDGSIFTDIANFLSVDNGLIVTWFTPTTLINLELDTIIHSMVTECIVVASTKVGFNPFYGQTFNMIVSSDDQKIYFDLTKIHTDN